MAEIRVSSLPKVATINEAAAWFVVQSDADGTIQFPASKVIKTTGGTISGALGVQGALTVGGAATLASTLSVSGAVTAAGLTSSAKITVSSGGAEITGNSTIAGTVGITGNVSVTGDLSVSGALNATVDRANKDGDGNVISNTYLKQSDKLTAADIKTLFVR